MDINLNNEVSKIKSTKWKALVEEVTRDYNNLSFKYIYQRMFLHRGAEEKIYT